MKEPPAKPAKPEKKKKIQVKINFEQRRDNYLRSSTIFALQSTTKTLSVENEIQ